jgi:hypothetical protein
MMGLLFDPSFNAYCQLEFPVLDVNTAIFHCTSSKIPCSVAQGIWQQTIELVGRSGAKITAECQISQNSLLISLLAGNPTLETGSKLLHPPPVITGGNNLRAPRLPQGIRRAWIADWFLLAPARIRAVLD